MAAGNVGKLSITIYPNTRKFREDLSKALDRVERQVVCQVEVIPVVSRKAVADVRKDLKERLASVKVGVEASVSQESLKRVRDRMEGLEATAKVHVSQESLKQVKDKINSLEGTATVNTDLDKGKAAAQLAWLQRPRSVTLNVDLGKASLAAAKAALMALSGGNVLSRMGSSLKSFASNLDVHAVRLAGLGTAFLNVGALAMSAVSGVVSFGRSLAGVAPLALALPGVLGAVGVGAGVLVSVLGDAKDVLADLKPSFTSLQASLSSAFWDQAAQPVRDLVATALPALSDELTGVASGFGSMGVAIASALSDHISGFEATFASLSTAVNIAGDGVGAFVDGLLSLGEVGASFLPAIASKANDVAYSFQAWASNGLADGSIAASIKGAWSVLSSLGDLLVQVGGILGAVFSAVGESGSGSLSPLVETLRQVNAALSTGEGRDALVQVFASARKAVDALSPGISAIGQAVMALTPALSQILPVAGEIGSVALTGIAQAAQSLASSGGLQEFFDGVLVAVQALAPSMPALGTALGAVATTAGQLMAALGPVVAELVTALAPIITDLSASLAPVIQMLGEALVPVIRMLAPVIAQVFSALMPLVTEILAALLPALTPIIAALSQALIPAIQLVAQVIQTMMPIIKAEFEAISEVVTAAINVVTSIIQAALDLLTGNWSGAWEHIKDALRGVWDTMVALVQGAVSIFMAPINDAMDKMGITWSDVWNNVKKTVSDAWTNITSSVSGGITNMMDFINAIPTKITSVFSDAGSWLSDAGRKIIDGFVDGIKGSFDKVKSSLSGLTSLLPDWKGPAPLDKVILKPAGRLVMGGFVDGLESQYSKAHQSLGAFTKNLPTSLDTDNPAPSRAGLNASFEIVNHDPQVAARWVAQEMRGLMGVM